MCLITKQKKAIIIKDDMIVYKRVDIHGGNEALAPMQGFLYVVGENYNQELVPDHNFISCFSTDVYEYYKLNTFSKKDIGKLFTHIHNGFHFFKNIKDVKLFCNDYTLGDATAKCIIPKGSSVFFDETGLGVSNSITIVELIKD